MEILDFQAYSIGNKIQGKTIIPNENSGPALDGALLPLSNLKEGESLSMVNPKVEWFSLLLLVLYWLTIMAGLWQSNNIKALVDVKSKAYKIKRRLKVA